MALGYTAGHQRQEKPLPYFYIIVGVLVIGFIVIFLLPVLFVLLSCSSAVDYLGEIVKKHASGVVFVPKERRIGEHYQECQDLQPYRWAALVTYYLLTLLSFMIAVLLNSYHQATNLGRSSFLAKFLRFLLIFMTFASFFVYLGIVVEFVRNQFNS